MKNKAAIILIFLAIGCAKSSKQDTAVRVNDTTVFQKKKLDTSATDSKEWYFDLVEHYIANSKKELIVSDRKADIADWDLDNTEVCDTANYYIFKIGHTETDEGNTNPRFTASGWIYIDSLSQKIYEYDLPNDKLVLWKNN